MAKLPLATAAAQRADRLLLFAYLEELHEIGPDALAEVARDIAEEQGGSTGPQTKPTTARQGSSRESAPPAEQGNGDAQTEDRLNAMENNMASFTDAVREELSLLRQALLEQKRKPDGGDN